MALPINTVWEVRVPGSDTNGGGYVPGAGTDMSQYDNKNSSGGTNCQSTTLNLSTTDAVLNSTTTVTSATANFTSALVNNIVYIGAARYQVIAVTNSTTITVDRATGSGSSVVLNIGGALATPLPAHAASSPYAAGALINVWLKTATWTLAAGWTITITSSGSTTVIYTGYNAVRGDTSNPPLITSATNAIDLVGVNQGAGAVIFRNLRFTHTAATRGIGIKALNSNTNLRVERCLFDGCLWGINGDNVGSRYPWANAVLIDTEIKNCVTGGVITGNGNLQVIHSWIHNNTGYGLGSNNLCTLTLERSIVSGNGSYGVGLAAGFGFVYPTLLDSVLYANGGNGLSFTPQASGYIGLYARNCIFYGNTGYGLSAASAPPTSYVLDHNAYGANSLGDLQNLVSGAGAVTLAADPFTSPTNFALNSNPGGGALLKGAGYPGVFPGGLSTGALDIGAVQSAAGGGSVSAGGGSYTFIG